MAPGPVPGREHDGGLARAPVVGRVRDSEETDGGAGTRRGGHGESRGREHQHEHRPRSHAASIVRTRALPIGEGPDEAKSYSSPTFRLGYRPVSSDSYACVCAW